MQTEFCKLSNGLDHLYQYDSGVSIILNPGLDITGVEIGNVDSEIAYDAEIVGGAVRIRDTLLIYSNDIAVYAVVRDAEACYTRLRQVIPIIPRAIPDDYVPPSDWPRWHRIENKINAISEVIQPPVDVTEEMLSYDMTDEDVRQWDDEGNVAFLSHLTEPGNYVGVDEAGGYKYEAYVTVSGDFHYVEIRRIADYEGDLVDYIAQDGYNLGYAEHQSDGSVIIHGLDISSDLTPIRNALKENATHITEVENRIVAEITEKNAKSETLYPSNAAATKQFASKTELANAKKEIKESVDDLTETVSGLEETYISRNKQTLTDAEKSQVRENIGAADDSTVAEAMKNAVQIKAQSFTDAEKLQARENIGAVSEDDVAELVPIDATLSIENQAADAKVTGEKLKQVQDSLGGLKFSVSGRGTLVISY